MSAKEIRTTVTYLLLRSQGNLSDEAAIREIRKEARQVYLRSERGRPIGPLLREQASVGQPAGCMI